MINIVLKKLGITDGTTAWLVDGPLATRPSASWWSGPSGLTMMLMMAGMQAIPREYYDSAELDGAGWWEKEREITSRSCGGNRDGLIISVIGSFLAFKQFYILTRGGPGTTRRRSSSRSMTAPSSNCISVPRPHCRSCSSSWSRS